MLVNSSQVLQLHGVRSSVLLEPSVAQRVAPLVRCVWRHVVCHARRAVERATRRAGSPTAHMLELDPSLKSSHPMCVASRRIARSPRRPDARRAIVCGRNAAKRMRACYEPFWQCRRLARRLYCRRSERPGAAVCATPVPRRRARVRRAPLWRQRAVDAPAERSTRRASASLALIPGADLFAAPPSRWPEAAAPRAGLAVATRRRLHRRAARRHAASATEITADWFPRICAEEQLCSYGYVYDSTTEACAIDQAVNL
jgi:hypothetical protein